MGGGGEPGTAESTRGGDRPGVVDRLVQLADLVTSRRNAALAEVELDHGRFGVLDALWHSEGRRLTAGELSRRCGVTPGATSQRVAALEKAGLVRRVRDEPDRRTVHVVLTPAGVERLEAARAPVSRAEDDFLAGLAGRDASELERLLERLSTLNGKRR